MKNHKKYFWIDLIFIFIFLNIWDFAVDRTFLNGMVIGFFMFGPSVLLWYIGTFKSLVLVTLLSIFEFLFMTIFLAEGIELSGGAVFTLKSVFWLPFLIMAGLNGIWGLKIYSQKREKNAE